MIIKYLFSVDLSSKFSKTPPPSPVDLIMKERAKAEESVSEKLIGLQPKGMYTLHSVRVKILTI